MGGPERYEPRHGGRVAHVDVIAIQYDGTNFETIQQWLGEGNVTTHFDVKKRVNYLKSKRFSDGVPFKKMAYKGDYIQQLAIRKPEKVFVLDEETFNSQYKLKEETE